MFLIEKRGEGGKKMEKPLEKEVKEEQNIDLFLLEKPEPDKWYGTCYGRELKDEQGVFYQ